MQISWDSFKVYNQDARGIRFKFEDLCRQLFVNENISGNKQFRYLHANPNNSGLEAEPIYDEVNKRLVGFQAKYFDDKPEYSQIEHSVEQIVKYYNGKVDHVFLFCNRPLTTDSLQKSVSILQVANITLEPVTDNAILDLVRGTYPYLGAYYFGNHTLQAEWFINQADHMFDELGERYNRDFNVETDCSIELSIFLHDQRAVEYINAKKADLIKNLEIQYWKSGKKRSYLSKLSDAVKALKDVDAETLCASIDWFNKVKNEVKSYLEEYESEYKKLEDARDSAYIKSNDSTLSKDNREKSRKEYQELRHDISELKKLLELPNGVEISNREQQLLKSQVINLTGSAGTGKSQLLACKTNELLSEKRSALLLVAGIYFSESPICEQIMSNLLLSYSFEELIDVLETIGERDNRIIPIFIDALNETWNNKLWKTGLPLIIEKIKQAPMVKLVFSYRPEYEKILLSDYILKDIENGTILNINHKGFEGNSVSAVRSFLNHYDIPFTPLQYFYPEMTNPLFLTLYCKTYNGEEVCLPVLYERLIEKISDNVFNALKLHLKGYSEGTDFLRPLIYQVAANMINNEHRAISKDDLLKLDYWKEYGLVPAQLISQLIKEDFFHDYAFDDKEYYYFAYDQMNDYYCAKALLNTHSNSIDFRGYLTKQVLKIENGELKNYGDIDLFVNACALYADKFGEECIDIIDALDNDNDKWDVFSRYIKSFQWRDARHIGSELLYDLLKKYPCSPEELWPMLIGNSLKTSHPLNAEFLHEFLSKYELNKRDYLWTIYINSLTLDDENRIVQLIELYDRGEKLEATSDKQIELLLILFGWLLTSSNRWLRDYTSKAMIEILKDHYCLCLPLLEKFSDGNDPYVIQRLYGIVFGATCKRMSGELQPVAEYVYEKVFNQESVYPDILLRDYARLIIERFIYEFPNYNGIIDSQKIVPTYKSDPIPELEDQHYEDKDYDGAMLWLVMSMRIEKMGGYGDFGRYVFQRALSSFDVDMKEMFNYAVYHIINELGFSEEYFGEHDRLCGTYDRHVISKTERIGKKYQWITMYNMLARVSDRCKMIDRWNFPAKEDVCFEGAWDPYVRDFDPTLNRNFMVCNEAPLFVTLTEHKDNGIEENKTADISDANAQREWLNELGVFLGGLKETLLLTDDSGIQWVCLTKYCDTGRKDLNVEKLLVWSWLYAYFVTSDQAEDLSKFADKGLSVITNETASHHETYTVFNREYPWSPSCNDFEKYAWVNPQIKTGDFETVTEIVQIPDMSRLEALLSKYGIGENDRELNGFDGSADIDDKEDENICNGDVIEETDDILELNGTDDHFDVPPIKNKKVTHEKEIEKEIGRILHATTELLWEEEYDATKEEAISRSLPCARLIEVMGLKQLKSDGFFYDSNGKLAAFDTDLTQKVKSVVVRKDVLDMFLMKTGLRLVWLVDAEKQIHTDDYSITAWSDWEAVFIYDGKDISGEIKLLRLNNI